MTEIPAAEMGASGMPGRGLEYARPVIYEDGPAIEALCDCGTTTILTLDPAQVRALTAPNEFAFICDTCQSAHWVTIYPTGGSDG